MAKVEVSQAYRMCQYTLQTGICSVWSGNIGCIGWHTVLSSPLLFTALGDAVQWSVEQAGVEWLGHFIDDFVTVGRPITKK